MEHQDAVDAVVSGLLRPLVDQDLSVVFYDMTTIRAEGRSTQSEDLRHFGMTKEGVIARQVMLGVVQTSEGLPIYHEVRISAMAATDFNLIADSVSLRRRTAFHRDRGHREGRPSDRANGSAGGYRDRGREPALPTPARSRRGG
jgi:hypothetical protein